MKPALRHWLFQRGSALLLLPLSLWFVLTLPGLLPLSHAGLVAWLADLWHVIMLSVFIFVAFYHGRLGVEVVLEDYVHGKAHAPMMLAVRLISWVLPLAVIVGLICLHIR